MKIITLNLNGIRSATRKDWPSWFAPLQPDVVCMQETKAQMASLTDPLYYPSDYHCYFADAEKKGYSGVGIYSKREPLNVISRLGYAPFDKEGRYLQLDFDNLSIVSLYLPSGSSGEERQAIKFDCLEYFMAHLQQMRAQPREWIICGDFNIAHTKKDIKNWRGNQKNSGFLPEERAWMDSLFSREAFIDAFRVVNQEDEQYTWWSNRGQAWANNVGWRIDYQVITPGLKDRVKSASIYKEQRFSDHAPLCIDYEWTLAS